MECYYIHLCDCSHFKFLCTFLGNWSMTFGQLYCRIFNLHVGSQGRQVLSTMSTLQITSCKPSICFRNTSDYLRLSSKPYILPIHAKHLVRNPLVASRNASTQQQCMPVLKNQQCLYQQSLPVCLLSGKGKNGSDDEVRDLSI